jgi:hypothetical protein
MFSGTSLLAAETALFTVDVKLSETDVQALKVFITCEGSSPVSLNAEIPSGGTERYSIPVRVAGRDACAVQAQAIPGQQFRFLGDGGSRVELKDDGCFFTRVKPGDSNFCLIQIEDKITSITVYKKWVGTSAVEPAVDVFLSCEDKIDYGPKLVSSQSPNGWEIDVAEPEGVLCNVIEAESEAYVADTQDCRNMRILPGSQDECTITNTKVIKLIQVLNRYGLVIMILIFMVVGMFAVRRFS